MPRYILQKPLICLDVPALSSMPVMQTFAKHSVNSWSVSKPILPQSLLDIPWDFVYIAFFCRMKSADEFFLPLVAYVMSVQRLWRIQWTEFYFCPLLKWIIVMSLLSRVSVFSKTNLSLNVPYHRKQMSRSIL